MPVDEFYYAALCLVDGEQVLMQLRDRKPTTIYPGYWSVPGGMIEPGEEPSQTAIREFAEETTYQARNPQPLFTARHEQPGRLAVIHFFWERFDGQQPVDCLEGERMEFRTPISLASEEVIPDHLKAMEQAIEANKKRAA